MKTQLLKKYSAQLVKDCFKVGDDYYRALEMFEENGKKVYALQDIKNGGTTLIAVWMEEILDFIGEDYELVSVVATYDTPLSESARYILPQTEEMWRVSWKVYFEGETQSWQKAINNESEHDDEFFVEQAKVEINALKYVNNKIDEIFEELKKVKHVLFREDLSEKSVNEILKLLPDYIPNEYDEAFKVVNDKEYFIIEPTEYENNDGIEYAIDEGYKAYFKVSYHFVTELNSILSLNLEQRHHCFYAEMIY
ncbi:hypothetical protein [Bacillus cereus]|uniref:hypothetical protein n=1 Tax=Bacillus cereus TaxID=1396 RepID=UPI00061DE32E|nr:hypothetical protein [Bacillus cereus]AKE15666.1 hypothetical protein FORC5_1129 [Bacillus cereus]